jgi:hypothetical protein
MQLHTKIPTASRSRIGRSLSMLSEVEWFLVGDLEDLVAAWVDVDILGNLRHDLPLAAPQAASTTEADSAVAVGSAVVVVASVEVSVEVIAEATVAAGAALVIRVEVVMATVARLLLMLPVALVVVLVAMVGEVTKIVETVMVVAAQAVVAAAATAGTEVSLAAIVSQWEAGIEGTTTEIDAAMITTVALASGTTTTTTTTQDSDGDTESSEHFLESCIIVNPRFVGGYSNSSWFISSSDKKVLHQPVSSPY